MPTLLKLSDYVCFFAAGLPKCSDDGSAQQGDGHHADEEAAHDDADAAATAAAGGGGRCCSRGRIQSPSERHSSWWHGQPYGRAKHGPARPPAVWLSWQLW